MNTDAGFPHLHFPKEMTPQQRGHYHGEEYAAPIKELAQIRKDLMLSKSPHLRDHLSEYSQTQYELTEAEYPDQFLELDSIRQASGLSISDIVILNNYTDFRDIQLSDEGCTTLGINKVDKVSGQTWDMHSSAKNYVCTMEVPGQWQSFSLLGCLGMMGVNNQSLFVGVNNLNTQKAQNGIIWPALIRRLLETQSLEELRENLLRAKVTSGHNYLISDGKKWENWEIGSQFQYLASKITKNQEFIYHTNHCLHEEAKDQEEALSLNSTSLNRFDLIERKAPNLSTSADVLQVLQDHEGYPKSICSHFQSDATDPSTTCGGATFDHETKKFFLWRCCPKDEKRYIYRELAI